MNAQSLAAFVFACCAACSSDDDSSSTAGRVSDTSPTDGSGSESGASSSHGQASSESDGQGTEDEHPDRRDAGTEDGQGDPTGGSGDCVEQCVTDWNRCDAVEHEVVEDCQLLCEQLIPGFERIEGCPDAWAVYEECVTTLTCDEYEEFSAGEGSYPCLGEEQTYGETCFPD